jgi:two-component system sensor histidine kinase BaeS
MTLAVVGDSAAVRVADRGTGIAPADLDHIFDRFYRADSSRSRDGGGSGLGLAIARWIVERHGGAIAAESAPGRGTTIVLRLPLAGPRRQGAAAP